MVEAKRTFELLYDEPYNVKLLEDSLNEIKENSFDVLYRSQYKMCDIQRFDIKMGEFTLRFDPNGGTCDVVTKTVRFGKGVGNLPIAYKEGYVFVGWYTEPEDGYLISALYVIDTLTDIQLFAHWELPENISEDFDVRTLVGDHTSVKNANVYIVDKKKIINRYDKEFRQNRKTNNLVSEELMVYNIPIDFINYSRRAKYKTSKYYKQYVNSDIICANPDIFTNIFLVFIDGELYTNYKVKPFENISMIGFRINGNADDSVIIEDGKVVPRNFFTVDEFQRFAVKNSHMTIISISNCNTIKSNIMRGQNFKAKSDMFYIYSNYEDEYYERPLNAIERDELPMSFIADDQVRLYKYKYIDSKLDKTKVSVNDIPADVQYMSFNKDQMSILRDALYTRTFTHFMLNNWKSVELEENNRWFMLDIMDMPIPTENMMIFKYVDNTYLFDHTAKLEMYYPNVYRVVADHKEKIKIFVFYDDDTTAILGKYDNELKLYHRFTKNILDKYENDTIPKFIRDYKPVKIKYSIDDYESLSIDGDGNLINSGLTPLIYKIDRFKEMVKLRGENYEFYLNKLVGYEPTYIIDLLDGTLSSRIRTANIDVIKYLSENPFDGNKYESEIFKEPHYLFKFPAEGFNNRIIMFLNTKLYYPSVAYHTEQFLFIYIPTRLIDETTIIEIFKGVNRRFKYELEYKSDHSFSVIKLPKYTRVSVDDLYISYEDSDGYTKYLLEDDYDIYSYNDDEYANTKDTEYFRYPTIHVVIYHDKSPSHKYILRSDNINFVRHNIHDIRFNIDERINNDMRNIRIFKNGKLIPKEAHKMNWNKNNVFGIHKAKALTNNEASDEFVFVYSSIKHSLIYYQPKISSKGYIDLEGKLEKPLNQKWYDFYLNGHRLTKDNIDILTPTKMVVKGIDSTKNFCIYEKELYQQDGIYDTNYIDDQIMDLEGFLDEVLENYDDINDIEDDIMDDVIDDLVDFLLDYWMYFEFINPDIEQVTTEMLEYYPELFDENNNLFLNVSGRKYGIEYNILINPDVKGVPFIKKTL